MKRIGLFTLIFVIAFSVTACNAQPAPIVVPEEIEMQVQMETVVPAATDIVPGSTMSAERIPLDYTFQDALSARLLLALGTLELADTPQAITAEQAPQMLMLWQTLDNLTRSGTGADEEVNALLLQIEQTLSPEQVAAINALQLTQVQLQTWAAENGITVGTGTGQGTGQGMGQGANLTAEEKATRQALNGMTGNNENGLSSTVTQFVITYLETIK